VQATLDAEGQPLRLGAEAEPFLVSPNEREAEGLVGQEFHDSQDFVQALDHIADLGPRNVLITLTSGCYALLRDEREPARYHAAVPRIEPVSPVGSGDVLLAGFVAARYEGRSAEEALRRAVAAGAAAVQEVGAGRFEPREIARLEEGVRVEHLDQVVSEL
jgi:fructose-1-phosphate kinase PfkB-like protein